MAFKDFLKKVGNGLGKAATFVGQSGLLGPLGNVASSVIGAMSQSNTNKANRDLQQEQNQWNQEQWEKQQEYNSPANQMKRLEDAGINPVAQSVATGIDAGNAPSPAQQAPLIPNVDPMQTAGNFSQALASSAQLMQDALTKGSKRKLEIAQMEQEVENLRKTGESLGLGNEYQRIINSYADALQQLAVDKGKMSLRLDEGQLYTMAVNYRKMLFELDNILPAELNEILSKTDVNRASVEEISAKVEELISRRLLEDEQRNTEKEQQNLLANEANTEVWKQRELSARSSLEQAEAHTETFNNAIAKEKAEQESVNTDRIHKEYELFLKNFDNMVKKFADECKITHREAMFIWVKMFKELAVSGSSSGISIAQIMGALAKFIK